MSTHDLAKDPQGPIKMIYVEFIEFLARIADEYYSEFYGFDK